MHREHDDDGDSTFGSRPRLLLKDPSSELQYRFQRSQSDPSARGKLQGVYQHYLLVRPYPSLRIIFTSPSLRVPGILQSPFLSRISGSTRVQNELGAALASGRGVTAKVRWLSSRNDVGPTTSASNNATDLSEEEVGRPRWVHCTPLFGANGAVGVWMVVLVDEDGAPAPHPRRFRVAPPVAANIASHSKNNSSSSTANSNHHAFSSNKPEDSSHTASRPNTSHPLHPSSKASRNHHAGILTSATAARTTTAVDDIANLSQDDAADPPNVPTSPSSSSHRNKHSKFHRHSRGESNITAIFDTQRADAASRATKEGSGSIDSVAL